MKVTVGDDGNDNANDNTGSKRLVDERLKALNERLDELRTITNDFYIARMAWQERAIKAEKMLELITSIKRVSEKGGDITVELSTGPLPRTLWVYVNGVCCFTVTELNSLKLVNLHEMEPARLVPRAP